MPLIAGQRIQMWLSEQTNHMIPHIAADTNAVYALMALRPACSLSATSILISWGPERAEEGAKSGRDGATLPLYHAIHAPHASMTLLLVLSSRPTSPLATGRPGN